MLETDDVSMMQRSVDLDLTHQLLLGSRLCQSSLVDDLSSRESLCLLVVEFVAFSEPSFSKELSLGVLFDGDVTVEANNLLFYCDEGSVIHLVAIWAVSLSCAHCLSD